MLTAADVFILLNPAGRIRVVLLPTQSWELYNYIAQQQQQIERLKCCGNCNQYTEHLTHNPLKGKTVYACSDESQTHPWAVCKEWQGVE